MHNTWTKLHYVFILHNIPYFGFNIQWRGEGLEEFGFDLNTGRTVVKVNPKYFRPAEVETLLGDATKAKEVLGWEPKYDFDALVEEMVINGQWK